MKISILAHIIESLRQIRQRAFPYSPIGGRSCIAGLLILAFFWSLALPLCARANYTDRPNPNQSQLVRPVEAAAVRHAPVLNGRVEGSVRQLLGESVTLNNAGSVSGDLLVPGTPTVRINGTPNFGGTVNGTGSTQPAGYFVTLNRGSTLGRLVKRTDAIVFAAVEAPPASLGTRSVTINSPGQSVGNFATLRDLTVNSNVGLINVPPGTYRNFTANGGGFVFGVAGSTQPAVYNLNLLTLTSGTQIRVAGPVILTLDTALTANGATVGTSANPNWLTLKVASLGISLNSGSALYGIVRAPNGVITLNNSSLYGSVHCDRLILNGSGQLVGIASVPAMLDSVTPERATQNQTLNITLTGRNTHWIAGQTRASFGGEVSVGGSATGELGLVTVFSETTGIAELTVSGTAALSPRTVRVVTPLTGGSSEDISLTDAFTVVAVTPPGAASMNVTTFAGGDNAPGFTDGPAEQARFRDLAGIAIGPDDAVYIADAGNHRVRVVRQQADGSRVVQTMAGDGTAGYRDGAGAQASFKNPQGVAVDANGVVFVADTGNHCIRRITPDGIVSTLAGDGSAGYQNGAGAQARFNGPRGVTLDQQRNLYVADTGNSAVRLISLSGDVQTVAGDGTAGSNDSPNARFNGLQGVAIDGTTVFVYLADSGNHRIRRLDTSGTVITLTGADRGFADGDPNSARFAGPAGVAVDGAGRIVIADTINSLVRVVTPELISNGSPMAVTTVAGTGERGLTNGAGNVARFNTPQGVAVSLSSAIIVADTGNHVLRRIGIPPLITSFSPTSARVNTSITIYGEGFDGRAPDRNTVNFSRNVSIGGGPLTAQVTAVTRTQLSVVVPADAATGPVTVTTADGTAVSPSDFVLDQFPAPAIIDFAPKRGPVGTQVTLTGTHLKVNANDPMVTFAGTNDARLPALVNSASATEERAIVPNGAITGPIQLAHVGGTAATATPFTVDSEQDFQLTVAPSATTSVQGGSATYVVYVTSGQSSFSQLATLTTTGLPASITATFDPPQITPGGSSTLILHLSGTLAPGSYPLTIHGVATAGGHDLEHTAGATLNVMAGGETTLSGRVLSTEKEAIIGATVSLDGHTAMTDAAGAFLLAGVTAGSNRPLMVDGRTASAPNRTYPIIIEPASIVSGRANVVPYIFYLPPIDTQYEVEVVPGQNTDATNPRVPGLQMTIPAGANLRNRDGSPVARVSITPLAIDRTPAPLPANVSTGLVYTSQPGAAIADVPMPVVYPNLLGVSPGTRLELYAFNHDTVQWYVYGYGRVSSDGRTIAPEIDPGTGRPYGLRDFSWHFPNGGQGGNPGCRGGCGCNGPHPVNYATGIKLETSTDIAFGGARGGLTLTRYYTSDNSGQALFGRFGRGTRDNYEVTLTGSWSVGGSGRVIMPDEQTGRLFSYARTKSDGTRVFTTTSTISQLGDVVRRLTDGTLEYRYVDGSVMRFDAGGRMTAIADRNGNATTLTYTGSQLTRVTDAVGRSIILSYDPVSGFVSSVSDPLGRIWTYTYGSFGGIGGFLTAVTDPLGNKTSYAYDNARLTSVTDSLGYVVKRVTYDSNGRVIRQQFADGGFETYDYFLSGGIVTSTTITDALGRKTTKRFNANGYVVGSVDALGQSSQVTRDLVTNLATATVGPCGCPEETQQFDERGNIVTQTDRLGHTVRMEYEPLYNNPTKFIDPLGRVFTFGYDARGNLTSTTNAVGQTTSLAYDGNGLLASTTDPLGHTRRVEYDDAGNVSAIIDELGHRTTLEHDPIGRLTTVIDPLGRHTSRTYDFLDRIVSTIDPSGAIATFTYDNNGNLKGITDALNHRWTRTYDGKNRAVSSTDPLGRRLRVKYNTGDELTEISTPTGRAMHYTYTPQGLPETITDPSGGVLRSTYDSKGAVVTLTDPRGHTTTFTYDELGRPLTRRDALGRLSSLKYDDAGNLAERIDRAGGRTTFAYDALNRPTTVTYADAIVSYSYDAASQLTRIDDTQSGFAAWTYDDAGRLLTETTPNGVVSYDYNFANQPTSMTAADRIPASYGYDSAGRLQTITQGSEVFTYAYDQLSRLTSLQRPNGVTTTYGYDETSRLARLTHAQSQTLEDFRYTYTADNQVESVSSLASATKLAGQNNASAADAANRIAQFGPLSYTFNELGQTAAKTDPQGTTSYQWNARGRLTQATLSDGKTVSYDYDALGRRASRSAGGVTTSFLYNGANVVLDRSNAGAVDYLNGPGVDNLLRQTSVATGALYFAQDHLGSTVTLTNASGSVVERSQYEAFGQSSGSSLTRYGFTGREHDDLTGLMYYRARWYDPQQGRFISEDPIGFAGGDANLYGYVWQSPLGRTDPMGLDGWGNDSADWLDSRIEAMRGYLGSNPDAVYFNTGVNYATNIYHGVANLFRVGSGLGHAVYDECDNGYGRAASVLEDVSRAAAIFELLGGPAAGIAGSGTVAAAADAASSGGASAAAAVPSRLARVLDARFANSPTLGNPGATDVFVTAANDIAGNTSSQGLATRLTMLDNSGSLRQGPFAVIEFDTPTNGLASPVFRNNPGFLQGGLTRGGAREFLLPNLQVNQLKNIVIRRIP